MTQAQEIMTIAICVAGTMATRFLPFLIFREGRPVPPYVRYLGKALPSAIFAMLVVYCLKNVDFASGAHGLPEFVSIAATVALCRYSAARSAAWRWCSWCSSVSRAVFCLFHKNLNYYSSL